MALDSTSESLDYPCFMHRRAISVGGRNLIELERAIVQSMPVLSGTLFSYEPWQHGWQRPSEARDGHPEEERARPTVSDSTEKVVRRKTRRATVKQAPRGRGKRLDRAVLAPASGGPDRRTHQWHMNPAETWGPVALKSRPTTLGSAQSVVLVSLNQKWNPICPVTVRGVT